MSDDLLNKVKRAIQGTGYPLELEIAAIARRNKWVVFHSIEYHDPETAKFRELDLMLYKNIHRRRVELRISCKSSVNKQVVFFNIDRRPYFEMGEFKCTPLDSDRGRAERGRNIRRDLPMFSHPWGAVNYTVLTGSSPDREARSLLRDAIMSCVNSTHYRLLPSNLLFDARGTVYCFVVVLRGEMYSAHYSEAMQ